MLEVNFLSTKETRIELRREDDFTNALNERMYSFLGVNPSLEEYKKVCDYSAIDFSLDEEIRVVKAVKKIKDLWIKFKLPPLDVNISRTDGSEMRGLSYTRGNTIFLNSSFALKYQIATTSLITHEIFHVLSRQYPEIKAKAYSFFNFKEVPEVFPEYAVINPDAVKNNYSIETSIDGEKKWVVPFISIENKKPEYQVFNPLTGESVSIWKTSLPWEIGITTQYIAHAEEICADFFRAGMLGILSGWMYNPWKVKSFMKSITKD